jgi:hypothetical protein
MGKNKTILWRSILMPGHETCRLFYYGSQWRLEGAAAFANGGQPCLLTYQIICDQAWQTISGKVDGWLGNEHVSIRVRTDVGHHWWLNGTEVPGVAGCIDLDLNFSPSTNLIPVRQLNLEVGEKAELTAA